MWRILALVALAGGIARADPEGGGSNAPPATAAPIVVPSLSDDGRVRALGFDLRAARPIASWLSITAGASGWIASVSDRRGVHTITSIVIGPGLELRPTDRIWLGASIGVTTTGGAGGEAHVGARVVEIDGRWVEAGAYVSHGDGVTAAGVSVRYPF